MNWVMGQRNDPGCRSLKAGCSSQNRGLLQAVSPAHARAFPRWLGGSGSSFTS